MTTPPGPQTTSSEWAERLTAWTAELRPDWPRPGIRSAIRKVADRPLAVVALATLTAATSRPEADPAIIAEPGPHWPDLDQLTPGPARWCAHGRPLDRHCLACAPEVIRTGPTPEQRAAMRAAVREARP